MGNFKKKYSGFTLIELLIVIAIIGIMVGLAMPSIDRWYKIKRVQDAATAFASTFDVTRARAAKLQQPLVIGFVDNMHYGVFNMSGILMERNFQPGNHPQYIGNNVTSPYGGETMPNPMAARVNMGKWTGAFTGIETKLIIVMPNGSYRRFQSGSFGGATVPLGDIFQTIFTDVQLSNSPDTETRMITTWRVDIQPAGQVKVRRIDDEDII